MTDFTPDPAEPCPYMNDDRASCSSHFTLEHLSQAFGDCIGEFRSCSNFWAMNANPLPHPTHPQHITTITAHGRPLQPTGS